MTIYFYRVKDKYGCFSNFSPHGFELDNKHWPTSEHYFQAQKFAGTIYEEQIREVEKAIEAAKMGRNPDWPLRDDREEIKVDVMRRAVLRKFQTHEDIREVLLSMGDQDIVEI
ncbi:MAG: NADAR family protein [Bacillaceae bacterium]|nr:NADAR family protein [Bacillaceae bacterium]